jgi:hypothetical protein
MIRFFKSMMEGANGGISSKRFVGLLCGLSMFSCGKYEPSTTLVDAVGLLAFGCLGLTSVDFFTHKKQDK